MLFMLRRKQTTNHNTMKEINMKILQKKDAWTEDIAKVLRLLSRWNVSIPTLCTSTSSRLKLSLSPMHASTRI